MTNLHENYTDDELRARKHTLDLAEPDPNIERLALLRDACLSGDYRWGMYSLRSTTKDLGERCFCFLGLASEISGVGAWALEAQINQWAYIAPALKLDEPGVYLGKDGVTYFRQEHIAPWRVGFGAPPVMVANWYGWGSVTPKMVSAQGETLDAMQWNDTRKCNLGGFGEMVEITWPETRRIPRLLAVEGGEG
jgi:hypothetical protein